MVTAFCAIAGNALGADVAAPPQFSPPAGTYLSAQTVTISDSSPGTAIYFTTNGSTPTTNSTRYSGPVTVDTYRTLRAIAAGTGYTRSSIATARYEIRLRAPTPVLSQGTGSYRGPQLITITDAVANLPIYYTTNGSEPTTASTRYTGPVNIASSRTLKAIAAGTDYRESPIASAIYTIQVQETVLHSFGVAQDGNAPAAGLIQGSDGNFYGTTYYGGTYNVGTVFKMTPQGVETVLHSFDNPSGSVPPGTTPPRTATGMDGDNPDMGLVEGPDGNFYGVTMTGGANGRGTIFKVTPDGTESLIYSFPDPQGGAAPDGGLIVGADGNLYGTTTYGEDSGGTAFRMTLAGVVTVLHTFASGSNTLDASLPIGRLLQSSDGTLFGVSINGGKNNGGTVFKITSDGVESVLHSFAAQNVSSSDGSNPAAGLVQSSDGTLYGTAGENGAYGGGVVFKLTPEGAETIVHSFPDPSIGDDGDFPSSNGLIIGSDGNVYGVTYAGGVNHNGTVFEITPAGVETILYQFGATSSADGQLPLGGVVQATDGSFYGTTDTGGTTHSDGTVFKLINVVP